MEYIRSLGPVQVEDGCFLCTYWNDANADRTNHVLQRGSTSFVLMNRFPYTNGHLLVAHAAHKPDLTDLNDAELVEITLQIRLWTKVLRATLSPDGFNIGYNIGRCAGAGLPGHLHAHIVPRWNGDTNFMAVVGDARVIPDALDTTWNELMRRHTDVRQQDNTQS
jgi:ATP adenylyltransferase